MINSAHISPRLKGLILLMMIFFAAPIVGISGEPVPIGDMGEWKETVG